MPKGAVGMKHVIEDVPGVLGPHAIFQMDDRFWSINQSFLEIMAPSW
jgi:hypothetical protein